MQHSQTAGGCVWRIKGLYADGMHGPHPGSLPGAPCGCARLPMHISSSRDEMRHIFSIVGMR